jgi:hypothetical protein
MQEVKLAILNPVATIEVAGVKPAQRITDLDNKRIGLFWNRKARGDVALRKIEAVLTQRFRGLECTWFEMQTSIALVPAQVTFLRQLNNDAIISASGD